VEQSRNLPDFDRISVLIAMILLAYATAQFVNLPGRTLSLEFAGIYLPLQFNVNTLVALAVAGMTASGTDWLLRDHPRLRNRSTFQHWLLPGLTAWVISVPLNNLPVNPMWWLMFAAGGLLLLLALIAEYIVVDPEDARHQPAAGVLTALSYALFLILTISFRSVGLRLLLMMPPLGLAAGLISLRTIHLRLNRWQFPQALVVIFIISQLAAALHYLPFSPIAFSLALLGTAYALTNLLINIAQEQDLRQAISEPTIILIAFWSLAIWFR
jgi:hypothetical protein